MRGAFESIVVRRKGASTIDADGEGIWTASTTDTTYKGSIHQTSTEEGQPEELGKYGERKRLTVRLPKHANVMNNDEIVILNYHANMNGVYSIEGIFFTHTHLRLELRKTVQNA
jgi:hypothetical protein